MVPQSVKKYSGTTRYISYNATFKISKANTSNPPSPLNQCCESRERGKNQKLHVFWQPATLIEWERGLYDLLSHHNIFLADCLKTNASEKMKGLNSDKPKILESIFLCKFLMFRFQCVVKVRDKIFFLERRKGGVGLKRGGIKFS